MDRILLTYLCFNYLDSRKLMKMTLMKYFGLFSVLVIVGVTAQTKSSTDSKAIDPDLLAICKTNTYSRNTILDAKQISPCQVLCLVRSYIYRDLMYYPRNYFHNLNYNQTVYKSRLESCGDNKVCYNGQCLEKIQKFQPLCSGWKAGAFALPQSGLCRINCVIMKGNDTYIKQKTLALPYKYPCMPNMGCTYEGRCLNINRFSTCG